MSFVGAFLKFGVRATRAAAILIIALLVVATPSVLPTNALPVDDLEVRLSTRAPIDWDAKSDEEIRAYINAPTGAPPCEPNGIVAVSKALERVPYKLPIELYRHQGYDIAALALCISGFIMGWSRMIPGVAFYAAIMILGDGRDGLFCQIIHCEQVGLTLLDTVVFTVLGCFCLGWLIKKIGWLISKIKKKVVS